MELSQHYYLGNDAANPFYYCERPLGYVDGIPVYEGDSSWLCCLLEDEPDLEYDDIPF
jgi:hypothetical protein